MLLSAHVMVDYIMAILRNDISAVILMKGTVDRYEQAFTDNFRLHSNQKPAVCDHAGENAEIRSFMEV